MTPDRTASDDDLKAANIEAPDPYDTLRDQVRKLHAEYEAICLEGDRLQSEINRRAELLNELSERREAIWRELRTLSTPPSQAALPWTAHGGW